MSAYEGGQNSLPDIPAERWRELYMEAAAEIERLRSAINSAVAAERERWAAIAKSHMDMSGAMGAKEKARTAASILNEGLGA